MLTPTLIHCVTLGKIPALPGPQFPHLLLESPVTPRFQPLPCVGWDWVGGNLGKRKVPARGALQSPDYGAAGSIWAGRSISPGQAARQRPEAEGAWGDIGKGDPGPGPTCPICLPALRELGLGDAPQALGAASPISPQAWHPMEAPLPPGPHQPLHLVCQPAALPGGKRAQERVRTGRKKEEEGCVRDGKDQANPHWGLCLS